MNDRLIEFRAWDKFQKKMISWDECLNNEALISEILLNSERYEPMQCTGLKDKNGRLIYEGDIVNILCEVEEQGVVEWATEEAQFVVSAEQAGFVANFDNYRGSDLEVIGSIYENSYLLEHSKCEGGFILK